MTVVQRTPARLRPAGRGLSSLQRRPVPWIQRRMPGAPTRRTATFTMDAIVAPSAGTATFTTDAIVAAIPVLTKPFTMDAVVEPPVGPVIAQGVLVLLLQPGRVTATFTMDAIVASPATHEVGFTTDAIVAAVPQRTKPFTMDAIVAAVPQRTKPFTMDAIVQDPVGAKSFTMDAIVKTTPLVVALTFTMDAVVADAPNAIVLAPYWEPGVEVNAHRLWEWLGTYEARLGASPGPVVRTVLGGADGDVIFYGLDPGQYVAAQGRKRVHFIVTE